MEPSIPETNCPQNYTTNKEKKLAGCAHNTDMAAKFVAYNFEGEEAGLGT